MTSNSGTAKAVLDSSAVLAWIFREKGEATVRKLMPHAVITSANLAEVVQLSIGRNYGRSGHELRDDLEAIGVRIVPVSDADGVRIGELLHASWQERDQHFNQTLALGDAACIAVAERLQLQPVTADGLWFELQHLFGVEPLPFR